MRLSFLGSERTQHITSIHFDEEQCNKLLSHAKNIISIHGKKGAESFVMLGGLDSDLISSAEKAFVLAGFAVRPPESNVTGTEPHNVCNRGTSGKGLQIEMSRGLRDSLVQDPERMETFSKAIRSIIH